MTNMVFAILAHNNRGGAVNYLADNLAATCPSSDVVVFNGGPDDQWVGDVTAKVVGAHPFGWGKVAAFHYLTMQAVEQYQYDALVTLDFDMAMVKPGFERHIGQLLDTYAYIGTRLHPVDLWSGGNPDRQVWNWWHNQWAALFEAPQPYCVFNPCQVFRRDLVDRFLADPAMPSIIDQATRAQVFCMEEIVYATRTVAYGMPTTSNPGSHGILHVSHDADELELLAADPHVHLVHKITERHQRLAVDRLLADGADADAAARRLMMRPPRAGISRRTALRELARRTRGDLRGILGGP